MGRESIRKGKREEGGKEGRTKEREVEEEEQEIKEEWKTVEKIEGEENGMRVCHKREEAKRCVLHYKRGGKE